MFTFADLHVGDRVRSRDALDDGHWRRGDDLAEATEVMLQNPAGDDDVMSDPTALVSVARSTRWHPRPARIRRLRLTRSGSATP